MSKWTDYGERFLELRAGGMSYRRITDHVSVSVTTLKAWGVKWQGEIEALAASRLEEFVKAHLLDVENRLKLRGRQLERIGLELETRDLSDMDTAQLLRVYLRYVESVQKDVDPIKVEVNSSMRDYEEIIRRCAKMESGPDAPGELSGASES